MLKRVSIAMMAMFLGQASVMAAMPKVSVQGDKVSVGRAHWERGTHAYQALNPAQIPAGQAVLVFIRPATNTADQSSANVAINNRFLVSLQAGHYTQALACQGDAWVSILPTGEKSNDLRAQGHSVNLQAKQTYYFMVDVDKATNTPSVTPVDATVAKQQLAQKIYQSHQISRVVTANCPVTQ